MDLQDDDTVNDTCAEEKVEVGKRHDAEHLEQRGPITPAPLNVMNGNKTSKRTKKGTKRWKLMCF